MVPLSARPAMIPASQSTRPLLLAPALGLHLDVDKHLQGFGALEEILMAV